MSDAFHMGGFGMYPTTVFGILLIVASLRYAVSPERRFVPLQVSLGIMTLASGGLGFVTGLIKSITATTGAGDMRLWVVGMGESLNNLALALALLTLGAMAASVGALRLARETPSGRLTT